MTPEELEAHQARQAILVRHIHYVGGKAVGAHDSWKTPEMAAWLVSDAEDPLPAYVILEEKAT